MISAKAITQLESMSRAPDEWAERFRRYAAQARDDFAVYAWLEARGLLPAPDALDDPAWRWGCEAKQAATSRPASESI